MRDSVRAFVAAAAANFDLRGPVYEFGSYLVPGQEEMGNLRTLFPHREYVGCDMREGPGVDRIEDVSELTLDDESVPTIICVETLEHVFEVRRAVDEILRVLAPGGMVVITTPFNFHLHSYPGDFWRLTPSCVQGLLSPLAATVVGSQGVESFPHAVFAIGCKAPVPIDFAARAERMISMFQTALKQARAAEPFGKRFKRRIVSMVRSKGERRREREYHDARFVTSYPMTKADALSLNAVIQTR